MARLRECVDYDPETGLFIWRYRADRLPRWNTRYAGTVAGHLSKDGRRRIELDRKYLASRLAWLYMTGGWPKDRIDHINGDPSDNRFANLRECTQAQNMQNRLPNQTNESGHIGVRWSKGKWQARIAIDGNQIHLGRYNDLSKAIRAYEMAKPAYHKFNPTVRRPNG